MNLLIKIEPHQNLSHFRQKIDGCTSGHPLVREFKQVLKMEGTGRVVSLSRLRSLVAVNSGMENLSSGNQQDGVEFMTFLMDILPVEFTFHSRLEKVSFKYTESGTCPICGNFPNDRIETGNILHLSIANSGSNTIANLLVNYFSSQSLEGGKRCLYCCTHETCCPRTGKCVSRPVTTERKIVDFPNVLFIQVKRFETNFRTGYSSKILTDVKVEESVTMDGVTYNIKGILNHIGTFENGHYTAIIKNKGLWYLCDDSNFPKVIAPKEVFNNCNYLFVYEKSKKCLKRFLQELIRSM